MEKKRQVLFVAGDGASGRITAETGHRLSVDDRCQTVHVVQEKGGASALYRSEGRSHHALAKEALSAMEAFVAEADLVVVAHSGVAFQLECTANRYAFEHGKPCIRVFDNYLSKDHAYFPSIVDDWRATEYPPFTVTALTELHAREMGKAHPDLAERITIIGNPLHFRLEQLLADGHPAAQKTLRRAHGIWDYQKLAAVFLSGNNALQIEEIISSLVRLSNVLAERDIGIVLDAHFEIQAWKEKIAQFVYAWRETAHLPLRDDVPHDEMIAMADLMVSSPFSTTGERGLVARIPVIHSSGPATDAELKAKTKRSFPFLPEHGCGAVLWAKGDEDRAAWSVLLDDALDPRKRSARSRTAAQAGLLPPHGAIARLITLIEDRLFLPA